MLLFFQLRLNIFVFFITLNNIVLLILMVIECNSIYIRTEGIKQSNYKWVIWTAKLAEIHVIFSSFSCFHLFIKSFHQMQLLFAHKIRLSNVMSYIILTEKSKVNRLSVHNPSILRQQWGEDKTHIRHHCKTIITFLEVSCQLSSPASRCNISATRQICCFSIGDSVVIFLQHRI